MTDGNKDKKMEQRFPPIGMKPDGELNIASPDDVQPVQYKIVKPDGSFHYVSADDEEPDISDLDDYDDLFEENAG